MSESSFPDTGLPNGLTGAAGLESAQPSADATAGGLLKAARESRGLHIAALAAALKVTPRKLEALENNRLQELPDATFARALAQSICRHLKIDPKPVLELLPPAGSVTLETASRVQSTPFKQKTDRPEPSSAGLWRPLLWGAGLLLVGAAAVFLVPAGWLSMPAGGSGPAPAPAASSPDASAPLAAAPAASSVLAPASGEAAASAPMPAAIASAAPAVAAVVAAAPAAATETVFSAPPSGGSAPPAAAGALVVTTTDSSWIEVRDARGQVLLSETVQPGRIVGLDGALPLQILVGNAAATQMQFKGRTVDVAARARENIARFELK